MAYQLQSYPEDRLLHRYETYERAKVHQRQATQINDGKAGSSNQEKAAVLLGQHYIDKPLHDERIHQCENATAGDAKEAENVHAQQWYRLLHHPVKFCGFVESHRCTFG